MSLDWNHRGQIFYQHSLPAQWLNVCVPLPWMVNGSPSLGLMDSLDRHWVFLTRIKFSDQDLSGPSLFLTCINLTFFQSGPVSDGNVCLKFLFVLKRRVVLLINTKDVSDSVLVLRSGKTQSILTLLQITAPSPVEDGQFNFKERKDELERHNPDCLSYGVREQVQEGIPFQLSWEKINLLW